MPWRYGRSTWTCCWFPFLYCCFEIPYIFKAFDINWYKFPDFRTEKLYVFCTSENSVN